MGTDKNIKLHIVTDIKNIKTTLKIKIVVQDGSKIWKHGSFKEYYNICNISIRSKSICWILEKGMPNLYRRFMRNVFFVAPPTIALIGTVNWANEVALQETRKDPKEFENDE